VEGRKLPGKYDLTFPKERSPEVVEFLLRMSGLEPRWHPPVLILRPGTATETRFRAPGIEAQVEFNRGPGSWAKPGDAAGSLSDATTLALLAEAARGRGAALDILAAVGPRDPPTVAALAKLLAEPALKTRAASALARFGFPARQALDELHAAAQGLEGAEAKALLDAIAQVEAARHPALLRPALAADPAPARFVARFETTTGDFDVEVRRDWAPLAADRFYNLVRIGFFDGCRFFRVLPGFVAQFGSTGDPEVNRAWYPAKLADEKRTESNMRGTLSFAAADEPNSRSTQVFVNLADNRELDAQGFAPFGRVVKGMEAVDRLHGGYGEAPQGGLLHFEGEPYLAREFPRLDRIRRATIIE
jgi:peptidyl-prolyl cis-trans isomerase A (cyclophilin A)